VLVKILRKVTASMTGLASADPTLRYPWHLLTLVDREGSIKGLLMTVLAAGVVSRIRLQVPVFIEP
jgi:hypothetical protein